MPYAQVILGLPVEGPFDYIIPQAIASGIKKGARVVIPFGNQKKIGYVVGFTKKTHAKKLKSILQLLDPIPLLNERMLLLARRLSEYYCCSWGQAVETAMPVKLRKGKAFTFTGYLPPESLTSPPSILLVQGINGHERWQQVYLQKIKETLTRNKSVIILLPDKTYLSKTEKIIKENFNCPTATMYRQDPEELNKWIAIKEGKVKIVIGTRSSIFSPLEDLGLIIVEEEEAYGYKQDQVPHYNARQVCIMRSQIENAHLILGSASPSLETMYLAKNNSIGYLSLSTAKASPEVKIINMKGLPLISPRKNIILSRYLEDSITQTLTSQGKILIFLNRRGFATLASCLTCGAILKCPRCEANLIYYYDKKQLGCRHCNYKIEAPKICPQCNAGYIRYSGGGTEKAESEFARLFPQAKIKTVDSPEKPAMDETQIFISTQSIIKEEGLSFDLIAVLAVDNSLHHVDFRASEKTFQVLCGLLGLIEKKLIIQTSLPDHVVFKSIENKNFEIFYNEEMRLRKELKFPPYAHLGLVKLRGKNEDKVEAAARKLFADLKNQAPKHIEIMSLNHGLPSKLRGNYYWQITCRAKQPEKLSSFLKSSLKRSAHSSIIVTVDIDPI